MKWLNVKIITQTTWLAGWGQVHRYCGGVYRPSSTVFEELDAWGISTPEHLRYYNYHAAYDFEAIMERNEGKSVNNTRTFIAF